MTGKIRANSHPLTTRWSSKLSYRNGAKRLLQLFMDMYPAEKPPLLLQDSSVQFFLVLHFLPLFQANYWKIDLKFRNPLSILFFPIRISSHLVWITISLSFSFSFLFSFFLLICFQFLRVSNGYFLILGTLLIAKMWYSSEDQFKSQCIVGSEGMY